TSRFPERLTTRSSGSQSSPGRRVSRFGFGDDSSAEGVAFGVDWEAAYRLASNGSGLGMPANGAAESAERSGPATLEHAHATTATTTSTPTSTAIRRRQYTSEPAPPRNVSGSIALKHARPTHANQRPHRPRRFPAIPTQPPQ